MVESSNTRVSPFVIETVGDSLLIIPVDLTPVADIFLPSFSIVCLTNVTR